MLDCQRESRHGVVAAAKQRPRKHLRRIQVKLLKKKGKAASTMAE
jgi:predicted hydrolase (HD superfamily)